MIRPLPLLISCSSFTLLWLDAQVLVDLPCYSLFTLDRNRQIWSGFVQTPADTDKEGWALKKWIFWTVVLEKAEKPGVLQSVGSQRVRHGWATEQQLVPGNSSLPRLCPQGKKSWINELLSPSWYYLLHEVFPIISYPFLCSLMFCIFSSKPLFQGRTLLIEFWLNPLLFFTLHKA